MDKAICRVMAAPIRLENSDQSQMLNQALFGETMDVLEREKHWTKVKMHLDEYEGWIDTKQISLISEEDFNKRNPQILNSNFVIANLKEGRTLLSIGSEVDFSVDESKRSEKLRDSIVLTAKEFLNIPNLKGGRSFFGIDCSGLVQLVFKVNGIALPRHSAQQADHGEPLTFVEESQPGDLAFFENSVGEIVHVGIMMDNQKIIHASGKVRIDTMDSSGIFNEETNAHTHRLRFVKNVID